MNKKILLLLLLFSFLCVGTFFKYGRSTWVPIYLKYNGRQTVAEVIHRHEGHLRPKFEVLFESKGLTFPPQNMTLIAFKDTNKVQLWAQSVLIKTYSIKAASGVQGPKLIEGDRQVPEGIYKISGFNPNSSYHLSMKLNYPNKFDLKQAKREGRTNPGGNIFIHGKALSIGCLAMGDRAIEELFFLVHSVKRNNVTVVITPGDPALGALLPLESAKPWVAELYGNIEQKIEQVRQ